jgi:hypothetical protein
MTHQKYEPHSSQQAPGKSSEFGIEHHASAVITHDQREHMIAEAAYYLAEHRHFKGGDMIHDWFQAQKEIDGKIKQEKSHEKQH